MTGLRRPGVCFNCLRGGVRVQNMPKLPGGCRMGQLTQTGYHMALDLGAWLRRRYTAEIEFLSPEYTVS